MLKNLPAEKLSFSSKGKEWRKRHVDWAENYVWSYDSRVRKSYRQKAVNYDLLSGRLDMKDLQHILNPNKIKAGFVPDNIQHFPVLNGKIQILAGEEVARNFRCNVVLTDYDSVNESQRARKDALYNQLAAWATQDARNEEEANASLEKIVKYAKYTWKDLREIRANALLHHYWKELDFSHLFNQGFYDAMVAGEEHYLCDIVGGEPCVTRINPCKMIVIKSGFSNRTEDADMIVLWDYWPPGKVLDTYYDVLTEKDVTYLNNLPFATSTLGMDNIDPMNTFAFVDERAGYSGDGILVENMLATNDILFDRNFVDNFGNVRVVRVFWKSYRKIFHVKSYDMESGEEVYNFYPETYVVNEVMGEEARPLWVTEAWEATKIGDRIYVNMRPRIVQYNRLSTPSRCHFGIVGRIYNLNEHKPFSLVDMAKPYNYLYDVVHDRLNKDMAAAWGKIGTLDLAKIPYGWDVERWAYYAKSMHLNVIDSFREGNRGAAQGKLAGMLSNHESSIDLDQGKIIEQDIQLLEFIKQEMGEAMGITRQREGQVHNRETVGGVERSVLQSAHTTEWLFAVHDSLKRAVCECFVETCKVALKGRSMKLNYLLDDATSMIVDFDGDEFAESDYGLVVENSTESKLLRENLTALAQALVQNEKVNVATLIKMWTSSSTADLVRSVKDDEEQAVARQQEAARQQQQAQQEALEAQAALEQSRLEQQERENIRDNETKILVEQIKAEGMLAMASEEGAQASQFKDIDIEEKTREAERKLSMEREKLAAKADEARKKLALDREKLKIERQKARQQPKTA